MGVGGSRGLSSDFSFVLIVKTGGYTENKMGSVIPQLQAVQFSWAFKVGTQNDPIMTRKGQKWIFFSKF